MSNLNDFNREAKAALWVALQWLLLAVPTGLVCGVVGTAFHLSVEYVTELRAAQSWLLLCLPLAGLAIVALYKVTKCEGVGTNNVIRAVQSGEPVSPLLVPAIFLGTVLTHLCGGSAGREGAALQMGGSIGWNVGKLLHLSDYVRRTATISGMAAFFSALFGTPLTAALFAMMVEDVGLTFTSAFMPAFTSALIAYGVSLFFGIAPTNFVLNSIPHLTLETALQTALLGIACAAVTRLFCWTLHTLEHGIPKRIPNPWLRAFAGGAAVVAFSYLFGVGRYNGAGMAVIADAVEQGTALPWDFLCKIFLTALTLAVGFKGGEVVPSFYIGATFGCVAGPLLGLPAGFAGAIGLVCVFCGATNALIPSILLGFELFGGQGLELIALGCGVCYMLSGHHGLYSSQTFVTNKLFGFPIFLLIMFIIFWATFEIGAYPMEWIEWGVAQLSALVNAHMPDGMLKDMIADGIIGGVGGVIVFLPNILILYFCISFMEDSGYMARAAFIMDKLMHRIGLHGKSFIPLIMGFGCNVPAIMSSRSIESRSSRIITILINPFMSCTARLPIYVLLVGTFFSRHAALMFMLIYLTGIAVAMLTARMLRKFYFKADETPFVMELPPYRIPTLKASLRHMWGKGEQYLKKMGGVILVASIIVWALNYFPLHNEQSSAITPQGTGVVANEDTDDSAINPATDSYLEMMGKAVNPVMEPLGFHWRATVATLAGIPAKEIVVSTLGVLYTGNEEIDDASLAARITAPNPITHKPDFTAASALSFIIFILLYCPCIATVTAIVRETGSWRYGAFSVLYNTAVAWVVAWIAYRMMLLF
mgnify:CR=1 FL=1